MSTFGTATEAPMPAEALQNEQPRHLRVVEGAGITAVAAELSVAYTDANDLPDVAIHSSDQLLFGD